MIMRIVLMLGLVVALAVSVSADVALPPGTDIVLDIPRPEWLPPMQDADEHVNVWRRLRIIAPIGAGMGGFGFLWDVEGGRRRSKGKHTPPPTAPVPEPTAWLVVGLGLMIISRWK